MRSEPAGFFKRPRLRRYCARIFYGLDRFSEDLDFSLMAADDTFDLTEYFPTRKGSQSMG